MDGETDGIGWRFPKDGADQWDGFNDSGIEHFRGNPLFNLARETIQNSLDAPLAHPVKVSFTKNQRPVSEIPGIDDLKLVMKRCEIWAKKDESEHAKLFFDSAQEALEKSVIDVLTVSDSNTCGITGPCRNGTPLYAFMKATGQSKKGSGTASGSYGIGKYAPYAVSKLRTIFVSTVSEDEDTGNVTHYFQGKSVLMSHYDDDEDTRQGFGYWGRGQKCLPIEGESDEAVPSWLKRTNAQQTHAETRGTSVNILGFTGQSNWEDVLAASVAENFFAALWQGKLEVDINNKWILSKDTLDNVFASEEVKDVISLYKSEPEYFLSSKKFLNAEKQTEDVIVENTENRDLGHCTVKILLGEDYPKRVGIIRNGMLITQELQQLRRFSDFKEFVAVVECHNNKGNQLLRAMEPPRHDDFEPERLPSPEMQRLGRRAIKDLGKWVREMLKRHAQDEAKEVTEIDELKDYLGDEEEGEGNSEGDEINPLGKIRLRAKPVKKTARSALGAGTKGGGGNDNGENSGEGSGGESSGSGSGENSGNNAAANVQLNNLRAVISAPKKRRISVTPDYTGKVEIQVFDSGADTNAVLNIAAADIGNIKKGKITDIELTQGQRISFEVTLEREHRGSMKVVANAV